MAKVSKKYLVSDVILKLTQSSPSQDTEIEDSQIAYLLTNELNFLMSLEVETLVRQGKPVPPIYLIRETCKQLSIEDVDCVPTNDERLYFALTGKVLDVENDAGIVQVLTSDYQEIYKAYLELLPTLKQMRWTRPSSDVLIWSRQGDTIFVEGFLEPDIDFNDIIVSYVPKQNLVTMADDDLVIVSDKILTVLTDKVADQAKLMMYGTQPDTTGNDSTDIKGLVYHRAIQNQDQPQDQ